MVISEKLILEKIWNSSVDGIVITDNQGIVMKVNGKFSKIINISEHVILNQQLVSLFPSDIQDEINTILQICIANVESPKSYSIVLKFDEKTTSYLDITFDSIPLPSQTYYLLFFRDVTHQKIYELQILEKNEVLNLAFDNDKVAWWRWDYPSGKVEFSPNKANMIGYSVEEFPVNVYEITKLIHKDDFEATMAGMKLHLIGKAPFYEVIYRIKNKWGGYTFYYDYGKIIERTPDGKPKTLYGIVFNISQQKNYEIELVQARKNAEESDKLKTSFLQNLSHEIRTPLNAVCGFSGMLARGNQNPEKKAYFEKIIYSSAKKLIKMIEDTIVVAHIETGQLVLDNAALNLNEFLLNIYNETTTNQSLLIKSNFEIVLDVPQESIIFVCDSIRIKQIYEVLIENAIKFTTNGTITIGYRLNNTNIILFVKDTGIGIPVEKQDVIYKSFAQADDNIRLVFGGLGLGLSILKGIVNNMKGQIVLNSIENVGTEFSIILPYEISELKEDPKENKISIIKSNKFNVLIADDIDANFLYLSEIIADLNCNVIRANDGIEAVEIAKNNSFDLIFMDLKMPNLNGIEATAAIRRFDTNVRIIAQTAYVYTKSYCFQNGFNDFVTKPYDTSQIIGLVTKHLQ